MSASLCRVYRSSFSFTKTCGTCRAYSKNVIHRKPIRVLNVQQQNIDPIHNEDFSKSLKLTREKLDSNEVAFPKPKETQIIVPPYEKLQKNDARFTKDLAIIKNRLLREKHGKILLEGKRLINDAITAGAELKALYFSRESDLADIKFKNQTNVSILKVMYRTLKVWSGLTTCPGVMGVFKRPTTETIHILSQPVIPVTIICDNIRDPGNLGSIIRNAAAAGCEHILLMKGCVDPWEIKVLRAGSGGHFRIPVVNNIEWTHINNYIPLKSTIFIADNSADIQGSTVSPELIDFNESPEDTDEEDTDMEGIKKYVRFNEGGQTVVVDETYNDPNELEEYEDIQLPCHLYSSIKYPKDNIVLYVGGETHGVDSRIVKLACDYGGKKIKIPLENNMDSLNSSFAMTIVLYEIKRQLSEAYVTK